VADQVVPHNDLGVQVIEIGAKKFMFVWVRCHPNHPHVFCDMGDDKEYVCPYCSTLYRHHPALAPNKARPTECEFHDLPRATRYLADRYAQGCLAVLGLKHLDANLGHTTIRNPQAARRAEREVEDAVANPWSAVGDHHYYRSVGRKISNANSRAERQAAVCCSWQIPIER